MPEVISCQVRERSPFPESLFAWGNSGSYAISRGSDGGSGWQKPPLRTRLIMQLEALAEGILGGSVSSQVNIFLVGGPGNGKTHAAKYFLKHVLKDKFDEMPTSTTGSVTMDFADSASPVEHLHYIEDASAGQDNGAVYKRFVDDVEEYVLEPRQGSIFLCCVNRGILATVLAKIAKGEIEASQGTRKFIATLSSVVSPDATPRTLWPFEHEGNVYIHPMDEESLLECIGDRHPVAIDILDEICAEDDGRCQTCANAQKCPICANIAALRDEKRRGSLLKILRYYEIVASRRLSFRDLFSVFSQLAVGLPYEYVINGKKTSPCKWVEKQIGLSASNLREDRLSALFALASTLYHNRLFGTWDDFRVQARPLLKLVKGSKIASIKAVAPVLQSIAAQIRRSAAASAQNYLPKCAAMLDPSLQDAAAIGDGGQECIEKIKLYEDAFCKSLTLGIDTFLNDGYCPPLEVERDLFLEVRGIEQDQNILDMPVSDPEFQTAQTILSVLRVVLSRMAKRAIGAFDAFVYASDRLDEYRAMLDNDMSHPNLAAKKRRLCTTIQGHLFPDGLFSCSMLATLGQAEPDEANGFFMKNSRSAHFAISPSGARADMTRNLLFVRETDLGLSIKVNFDIYSALVDLQNGLKPASLPARINDIFDGVKSRIQGRLCHNWDLGASRFLYCDRDGARHYVSWNPDEGFFPSEI